MKTTLWLFTLSMMMTKTSSPMKLTINLVWLSILSMSLIYKTTNSMLAPMLIIITFSSGMMILFSYCSKMTPHQNQHKTHLPTMLTLMVMTMILLSINPKTLMTSTTIQKTMSLSTSPSISMITMIMVILTMTTMNTTFFNPTKKIMKSY